MLQRAENIRNRIKQTITNLENIAISNQSLKNQLLEVCDAELGRVEGFIDGISNSQKGGNFVDGFQRGGEAFFRFEIAEEVLNSLL